MDISDAQREVRTVFRGGCVGQFVSGLIWLASGAIANFYDATTGFWVLALGGAAIFPLTVVALRILGHRAVLSADNPLRHLAMQIAFTIPLVLPVAAGAALYRAAWFYPACMLIVGAHYLPFVFLYGMTTFAVLAAALIAAGLTIGLWLPEPVSLGAWVGGAILVVFAVVLRIAVGRPPRPSTAAPVPLKGRSRE